MAFFVVLLAALATAIAMALLAGARRWRASTDALHARVDAARLPISPLVFDARELEGLPAPVQRYFRLVLSPDQPLVSEVVMAHQGTFNLSEKGERWRPFSSRQRVVTRRPGFVWDARIAIAPGLTVRVHDAYVAGAGILKAAILGLIPVADMRGTPEMDRGELLRFFAETAWYPTALLPSQGVTWKAIDETSAVATLVDGGLTLEMSFEFDPDGLIRSVRAETRGRAMGDSIVPTPWEGRWRRYERRGGMLVPLEGEVAWLPPEGRQAYWRGRVTRLEYRFAD